MATCFGVTKKLRRCSTPAGEKWFCQHHDAQPRYFLVIALTSIVFSYIAGVLPIPWRDASRPLVAGDFQIHLLVSAHASAIPTDHKEPQRIAVYATLGPVLLESEMELQSEPAREYPSTKNPNAHWKYKDSSPLVRFDSDLGLNDLVGKTLNARLPTRAFNLKNDRPSIYQLRVLVRGRELYADADEYGKVSLELTRALLE